MSMRITKRIGTRDYLIHVVDDGGAAGKVVDLENATVTISDRLPLRELSRAMDVCFAHEFPAMANLPLVEVHEPPMFQTPSPFLSAIPQDFHLRLAQ
jgi:hypothetical protein